MIDRDGERIFKTANDVQSRGWLWSLALVRLSDERRTVVYEANVTDHNNHRFWARSGNALVALECALADAKRMNGGG